MQSPQPTKSTIVTFHWALNYGASLQVFALQQVISSVIGPVEVLHYVPQFLATQHRRFCRPMLRTLGYLPANLYRRVQQIGAFERFTARHIHLSKGRFSRPEDVCDEQSDLIFLGSDQIWNPDITGGFDNVYFGRYSRKPNSKVISYAASVGKPSFSEQEQRDFQRLLQGVDRISVREESAKRLIAPLVDRPVEVVLDPTLLLDRHAWSTVANSRDRKPYVLVYSMAGYVETSDIAATVARRMGIGVLEILPSGRFMRDRLTHATMANVGPAEYLGLFENAAFVVTDSFHGTAFALIYNKDFFTVPHRERGGRLVDLLARFGLSHRLVRDTAEAAGAGPIDYQEVNGLVHLERTRSVQFLSGAAAG